MGDARALTLRLVALVWPSTLSSSVIAHFLALPAAVTFLLDRRSHATGVTVHGVTASHRFFTSIRSTGCTDFGFSVSTVCQQATNHAARCSTDPREDGRCALFCFTLCACTGEVSSLECMSRKPAQV